MSTEIIITTQYMTRHRNMTFYILLFIAQRIIFSLAKNLWIILNICPCSHFFPADMVLFTNALDITAVACIKLQEVCDFVFIN